MWVEEALTTKLASALAVTLLAAAVGCVAGTLYLDATYGVGDWLAQLRFLGMYVLLNAIIGGVPLAVWLSLVWRGAWGLAFICAAFAAWTTYAWGAVFGGFRDHDALAIAHMLTICCAVGFALFARLRFRTRPSGG